METVGVALAVAPFVLDALELSIRVAAKPLTAFIFFRAYYGSVRGFVLQVFGNRVVWKMQLQVLRSDDPNTAKEFRVASQQESNMVAVAGTILAQIAITAFSLESIQNVHWTSRGFFIFSLVSSIIAVYYASRQHEVLGRCIDPEDIKQWIRGPQRKSRDQKSRRQNQRDERAFRNRWQLAWDNRDVPSIAAVLTTSAPAALLATAVYTFLIGLGIYLGFVWRQQLGDDDDDLAIFITYIVALGVCFSLYAVSGIVASDEIDHLDLNGFSSENPVNMTMRSSAFDMGGRTEVGVQPEAQADTPRGSEEVIDMHDMTASSAIDLQQAFRDAARLRRDLAAADERIAHLLEGFNGR
ncbi:hypothetical protein BDV12DRAFT_148050 [Aspergillus spectabilis]